MGIMVYSLLWVMQDFVRQSLPILFLRLLMISSDKWLRVPYGVQQLLQTLVLWPVPLPPMLLEV